MHELPAAITATITKAAADLSGRDPGQLDAREAIRILQEYGPEYEREKPQGDLYRELTDKAAEIYFSNPQHVEEWQEIAENWDGEMPELLALTLQRSLSKLITREARKLLEELPKDDPRRKETGIILAVPLVSEELQRALDRLREAIRPALSSMVTASGMMQSIRQLLEALADTPAYKLLSELDGDLAPFIEEELKNPQYGGKTIDDLLDEAWGDGAGGFSETSLLMQAVNAARAARDAADKEEPLQATAKRAQAVEYPLDKPNSIIWSLLEKDTAGQVVFNMAKSGSKQDIPAYYSIDFDALGGDVTITKRLLPFDKRVYIAVSALFNAGNTVISLSQIYYAMGYTGRPNKRDLMRIDSAITKMNGARIFFDNEQESKKYKGYVRFKYDGQLLPMERETAIINGKLADAAIHIFREPPLITFAKQRKQITTINVKLLQSPINKTDANLQIDDYLIERISKAKNGKGHSCRILFKTLYERAGITSKKQAQRAPAKVEKYLTHYQREGFIKRFTMEKDGVTIYW